MRVGLIAVDGHNGFPNLALMRLSTWHKREGDVVEWWNGFKQYDRVYDYDGGEPTDEQKRFARWVNQKTLFKSCSWKDFRDRAT